MKTKEVTWKSYFKLARIAKLPWLLILASIAFGLFSEQLYILFPSYTQKVIAGDTSIHTIMIAATVLLFRNVFLSLYQWIVEVAQVSVSKSFRCAIWEQLMKRPVGFFDKSGSRDLISRVTSDTSGFSTIFTSVLTSLLSSVYAFVGIFIMLFSYNWRLAAIELVLIPLVVLKGIVEGKVFYQVNRKQREKLAHLTADIAQLVSTVPLIKSFGQEKKTEEQAEHYNTDYYKVSWQITKMTQLFTGCTAVIDVIQTLVVVLYGTSLVTRGIITLDIWIAFYLFARQLKSSVSSIMSIWVSLKKSKGTVYRLSMIMDENEEEDSGTIKEIDRHQALNVDKVCFSYGDKPVLQNISFCAKPGQKIALVGKSGSGKTTFFNLVERFYEPTAGKIQLGTTDIHEFTKHAWREAVGYVPQEAWIIDGTIRDNLLFGIERNVSDEELRYVAEQSNAMSFIEELEQGFDTAVGEQGSHLSGGQRQMIAIARMMLHNPYIVLLDEATSNLDAGVEDKVEEALARLCKERITLVAAHRPKTLFTADQILVLNENHIVEQGTHDELAKKQGVYSTMFGLV